MARLVERREPLLRRRAHLGRGGFQAVEHAVQLAGQEAQFVALMRDRPRVQITRRHPARLRDQRRHRAADDPGAHQQRHQHHRRAERQRRQQRGADRAAHVGAQVGRRLR